MALGTIGLSTFRWGSRTKSLFLVALFPLISLWLFWWQIYLVLMFFTDGITSSILSSRTDDIFYGWGGLIFCAVLSVWSWISWNYHASLIRGFCISTPVTAQEEPQLFSILETLSISQGIATPELDIIETSARNSFVCDIDGELSRIFVTRGLLETLSADEIEAVLAHEIAHILHEDNRLLSFSIAFSNLYPFLINKFFPPADDESPADKTQINPLFLIHPLSALLLAPIWIGYFVIGTLRILLFINRELDADATAYEITKNGDALMRALIRINRYARIPFADQQIRFLCIDNPVGGLFSTHPRLSTRLASLQLVSGGTIPDIKAGTPSKDSLQKGTYLNAPLINRFGSKRRGDSRFQG